MLTSLWNEKNRVMAERHWGSGETGQGTKGRYGKPCTGHAYSLFLQKRRNERFGRADCSDTGSHREPRIAG